MSTRTLPRWLFSQLYRCFPHKTVVRRRTVLPGVEWLERRELLSSNPGLPDFSGLRNDWTQFRNDMTTSTIVLVNAVQPSQTNTPTMASFESQWSKAWSVLATDWNKTLQAFVQAEYAVLGAIRQEFNTLLHDLGIQVPGQPSSPPSPAPSSPDSSPAFSPTPPLNPPQAAPPITGGTAGNDPSQTYTTPGTYTWTSPLTGTLTVELYGAGGGGGAGNVGEDMGGGGGGGGGGGSYIDVTLSVTAGANYSILVGAGGAAGSGGSGSSGGASSFSFGSTTYATANGGIGGGGLGSGPGWGGSGGGNSYGNGAVLVTCHS